MQRCHYFTFVAVLLVSISLYGCRGESGSISHAEDDVHGRRIVQHIIEYPAYRDRKQSTPTACRSEGILAFLRMARRADIAADSAFRERCLMEVEENLRRQLLFRRPDGAFIQGEGKNRVRIDYIQHNLSSFLDYHRLMRGGDCE